MYQRSCAPCHERGADRAPSHEALHAMSAERVLEAMESGPMISMANRRSEADRRAIAEFITGKSLAHPMDTAPAQAAMCTSRAPDFGDPSSAPQWNGWGQNLLNTRFQNTAEAGLTAADLSRLKVKWAFGFPATLDANAHPSVANGRIFIGSPSRNGLFTRRRLGLHSLVLQRRPRRALGRQHRPHPNRFRRALCRILRRRRRLRLCRGREHRQTDLEDQGGEFPGGTHHRVADFLQQPSLRARRVGRRGRRRIAGLRMLPFSRKHGRARRRPPASRSGRPTPSPRRRTRPRRTRSAHSSGDPRARPFGAALPST